MKKITLSTIPLVLVIVMLTFSCNEDDSCNETIWFQDLDGDGLGNPNESTLACEQPDGYVADDSDTNDDCTPTTWYQDLDGDGLGNPEVSISTCDQPDNYVTDDSDTDDDCTTITWYQDSDGDGLGNPNISMSACEQPTGYVTDNSDTDDDACTTSIWYQDLDEDGLGNPDVSVSACVQPEGYVSDNSDTDDSGDTSSSDGSTPISAFDEFNDAVTISFDGDEITIQSNGTPDHTSPYWAETNDLYIDPVVANEAQMSPGTIAESSYTLTVPAAPEKASTTSSTGLGAIGIAVSGTPIFNDEEGPNVALSANVASGFDYAGGHNGPTGYHYHLESSDVEANTTLSQDDSQLVGIMQDGFLLYGRRCDSIDGEYPDDLDTSGGHISSTQHSDGDEFYHYHIINEIYTGSYIVLFGADLQGTPNSIL